MSFRRRFLQLPTFVQFCLLAHLLVISFLHPALAQENDDDYNPFSEDSESRSNPAKRLEEKRKLAARESAIDRIVVPYFRFASKNQNTLGKWVTEREDYQDKIVAILNERSYLETSPIAKEFSIQEEGDVIVDTARESGADGVLAGEIKNRVLYLSLRSGQTGRALAKWSFPTPVKLDENGKRELINDVVEAVVNGFPYRGFVTAVKKNMVKLNLGKRQALRKGQRLQVFEFEGTRPTFSSPQQNIGEVIILKIAANAAIAKVINSKRTIPLYAKVAFGKVKGSSLADPATRYARTGWVAGGGEFLFLDTQVSQETPALHKRIYKLSLSPFLSLGAGYKRLAFGANVGVADNPATKVSFYSANLSMEVYQTALEKWGFITSLGAWGSLYQATDKNNPGADCTKGGALCALTSVTSYAPYLEERAQYLASVRTRLFLNGQFYFPVFANDAQNGTNKSTASLGLGAQGGVRIDLSSTFAVEGGVGSRFMQTTFQTGDQAQEIQFGLITRGILFF